MKADNMKLSEFIGASKRTFCIPVYQRNYDWKRNQCITLFEDIEKISKDSLRESHFLGTIVFVEGNSTPSFREFIVIDGQQRLTSIMLLLKALVDSSADDEFKQEIKESYLINKFSSEDLRIKLKPMKTDADNFRRLINNNLSEMTDSQISINYKLFKEYISMSALTPYEIFQGFQKLEIVFIQLEKEKENPQLIFESLNSTGLDLTQADLIRNYLLMGQSYRVQTELYNNYWLKIEKILPDTTISDFIRDYLTLKTLVIPNKDKVYQAFKDYYVTLTNYDAEGFLDELKTYAEYYSWFKYCNSPNIETNNKLSQLQRLKSTVVYPFLLNIFEDCYLYNRIDINEVNSTLTVIISYVLRRLICDLPTNALNKVFASLTKDIHKYDKYDLKDKVSIVLINKKGKTSFPNNIFFKEKILIKDCYNFPYIKYILEEIEKNSSREVVDFENLTIEHIMPQTLSAQWKVYLGKKYNDIHIKSLHKLGNLTLTAYNSDMSNSIFMDKKEIYKNSNLKMNRDIYNQYKEWGEVEIDSRSEKLFNELIGIWKYPDIQISDENVINTKTEFDITDDIDVTGKSPIELEICGGKYNVDCWRGFFKCVCQQMYEYDSQIFTSLIRHKDFQGRTRRIISDNPDELRESAKIADEIYIEQNLSANDALNYSKLVIEMYNDMENEVTYKIR